MKNYLKANNVKYKVGDITLSQWCENNKYPYAAAYQMLKKGYTIEDVVKIIPQKYVSHKERSSSLEQLVIKWTAMFQNGSRDLRLKIREKLMSYRNQVSEDKLSKYYEMIVNNDVSKLIKKENEVWKSVEFDSTYQVSNMGNFRKIYKNETIRKIKPYLKARKNKEGIKNRETLRVKLGTKEYSAARIVASAFIHKKSDEYNIVHLIDASNQRNVKVSNLKWVTKEMHGMLTGHSVKTSMQVQLFDKNGDIEETFESVRQAAKELGVSYTTISNICKGRIKKPKFDLSFGEIHPEYIPTWGYGGGKKRINVLMGMSYEN